MKHLRRLLALWLIVLVCPLWAQESESVRQLQKFVRTYRYLDRFYVDTVAMEPIVEGAIRGMLEQLDPHSTYLSVAEMKQAKASLDGSFSGIGIEFSVMRDTICVARTIAGGPAERVGVMANDRIVRIDSLSAVGMKQNDVKHDSFYLAPLPKSTAGIVSNISLKSIQRLQLSMYLRSLFTMKSKLSVLLRPSTCQ